MYRIYVNYFVFIPSYSTRTMWPNCPGTKLLLDCFQVTKRAEKLSVACSRYPQNIEFTESVYFVGCKGLAKLGNVVAETLLQTQMFPSLNGLRNICCGSKFGVVEARKCFWIKWKTFLLHRRKFCLRNVFPSLATQGNMSGNNVSATTIPF